MACYVAYAPALPVMTTRGARALGMMCCVYMNARLFKPFDLYKCNRYFKNIAAGGTLTGVCFSKKFENDFKNDNLDAVFILGYRCSVYEHFVN